MIAEHTQNTLNNLNYKDIEAFILAKQKQESSAWTIRSYLDIIVIWLKQLNEKKYLDTIKKLSELKPEK